MVKVEVIYLPAEGQAFHCKLSVADGSTAAHALRQSGLYDQYPEARDFSIGIFAKQISKDEVVKEADRIEVYRPLICDPKTKRRLRAAGK